MPPRHNAGKCGRFALLCSVRHPAASPSIQPENLDNPQISAPIRTYAQQPGPPPLLCGRMHEVEAGVGKVEAGIWPHS